MKHPNERIVKEVLDDFRERQKERATLDSLWLLDSNFYVGNQYAEIAPSGDVEDYGKRYYWQQREVFNRIAPLIETRISRLTKVDTSVTVRPLTADEKDKSHAEFSTKLLDSVRDDAHFKQLVNDAVFYSELMGTAFYKVMWNDSKGRFLGEADGKKVYEGDIEITVCPPYEIYPDTLCAKDMDEVHSLIHAKAYPIEELERLYGVKVKGEDVSVMDTQSCRTGGGLGYGSISQRIYSSLKKNHAMLIERYERPSEEHPDGRLTIVAGDVLVYDGALPYVNAPDEQRDLPFVRQIALETPASFFGSSVIDRLIPVQRAYNAVKNRKHEFLNRITMGIMTVEDGSVNVDHLEEEGLAPGKVIVYRRGANPPSVVTYGNLPEEFFKEEESLEKEFSNISGISDFMSSSELMNVNLSGTAINLLLEQDEARINVTVEHLKDAVKKTLQQVLRLYKQFATYERTVRVSGRAATIEALTFSSADLTADDLVFDTDGTDGSLSMRRNMVMEIVKLGLMNDENGKISEKHKQKILEALGFGTWQQLRAIEEIHQEKARLENEKMRRTPVSVSVLDDHRTHIDQHVRFAVGTDSDIDDETVARIEAHVLEHRHQINKEENNNEA